MKKAMMILLSLLIMMTQAGAAPYQMTKEDLRAIWADSCRRMNTTFEMELITPDELPPDSGREWISSLPMESDMPYPEALRWAKYLLNHRFSVSEETLDAMGVYPRLLDYLFPGAESVWEFLFSPLRDGDLVQKHALDELGEFHVQFGAQTGETTVIKWYSTRLADDVLIPLAEAAAQETSGLDAEAFADYYAPGFVHRYDQPDGTCVIFIYTHTVDQPDGDNHVYQVIMDIMTGEVIRLSYTDGVG